MSYYKDHPTGFSSKFKNCSAMLMDKHSKQPTIFGWLALIIFTFILMFIYRHETSTAVTKLETEDVDSVQHRPDAGRFGNVQPEPADTLIKQIEHDPQEEEFEEVLQHNAQANRPIRLPEFNPNKHKDMHDHDPEKAKHMEQFGRPQPKDFPVDLLNEPRLNCPGNNIQLIVFVYSRSDGTGERSGIRRTWGTQNKESFPTIKEVRWRTIFVMGMTETRFDQIVDQENDKYGDILQGKFKESPFEGVRKMCMALKWLKENMASCIPQFILKTNDNIFHNMHAITDWIDLRFKATTGLYVGKLLRRDHPVRNLADPYYVSENDYPFDTFPDMIQGPEYLFSIDVFAHMEEARSRVTPIAIEDGFIGLLAQSARVIPQHNDHFQMLKRPRNICHIVGLFFVFHVYPYEHVEIFNKLKQATKNRECSGADLLDVRRGGKARFREISV